MARGGARIGAGRKKQDPTVCYHRRVKPEWVKILDELLDKLKYEHKKTTGLELPTSTLGIF